MQTNPVQKEQQDTRNGQRNGASLAVARQRTSPAASGRATPRWTRFAASRSTSPRAG